MPHRRSLCRRFNHSSYNKTVSRYKVTIVYINKIRIADWGSNNFDELPAFIFDGRGVLKKDEMEALGFVYYKIGSGN